jgi:alkyl hydroperoxide reductase subunit AhpC
VARVVLLSAGFTFICPTELIAFGELEADFKAEEAVVVGASTDSFFSHKAWFESDARLLLVNYPVLADTSHQLSKGFASFLLRSTDGSPRGSTRATLRRRRPCLTSCLLSNCRTRMACQCIFFECG